MPRTVKELRESVLSYGFNTRNYATLVNHWIDEAQRVMFRQANLRTKHAQFEFTSIIGKKEYTIPSNFGSSISLRDLEQTLENQLERFISIEDFDNAETTQGIPSHFIIDNNSIFLYPTPNIVRKYSLRYNVLPSAIAEEESANPAVAEDYYYLIEVYCLYKAFQKEGDVEMANHYKSIFDSEMVEFKQQFNTDTKDSPEQVEGAWPMGYP